MEQFKELIIRKPKPYRMPQLVLNGKWLEELGFVTGVPVSVVYTDSCLILCTNDTNEVTPFATNVITVESRLIRKRPRTTLTLDGFLLKRYCFNSGDRVGLHLMPNMIQITKINRFTVANQK